MKYQCPLCLGKENQYIFRQDTFDIIQCALCSFAWLKDYPNPQDLQKIYQENYFEKEIVQDGYADAHRKYEFVRKYIPSRNAYILDFGCGRGDFMKISKQHRQKVYGYDVSKFIADSVSYKYNISVTSAPINKSLFKKNYFDVIVSFDVIEHIHDPAQTVKFFYTWLKHCSYLFMTTPNLESWDAKIFGKNWYGFTKLPQHINYFSPQSITTLLKKHNFTIEKIKLWGFVRTYDFILQKIKWPPIKIVQAIFNTLGLSKKNIYLPMVDMMVVAKKI